MKNINEAFRCLTIYPGVPERKDKNTDWHGYHKSIATNLVYAEQGSFAAIVANQTYIVREHQLVLFPAGVEHMYWKIPSKKLSIITFSFTAMLEDEEFFSHFGLCDSNHVVSISHERIMSIYNEMYTPKEYTNNISIRLTRCTHVSELLSLYLECRVKAEAMENELSEIISYMKDHLADDISIDKLASIAHLNPNYFITYFQKAAGIPPIKYLAQLRAQRAAELIKTTDMPLRSIATAVGINDIYYFKTFFEKNIGVAPSEYKKAIQVPADRPHMKTPTEYE